MHNNKMAQDAEHITEHLREQINLDRKLTPEELELYYFIEHDFNKDLKLDGIEILAAIKHSDLASELLVNSTNMNATEMKMAFDTELSYYTDIIDEVLAEDDADHDGYLSYAEYVTAKRRQE